MTPVKNGKVRKYVFCDKCHSVTIRHLDLYDDDFHNIKKLYENGLFGHCNKCGGSLSPKKFWSNKVKGKSVIKRVLEKADIKNNDDCWIWKAQKSKGGYGRIFLDGKLKFATHIVWEHYNKTKIDEKKVVCHKCDNPSCINPKHLFLGTQKENIHDSIQKGRFNIGEKNGNTKLTISQVEEIKSRKIKFDTLQKEANFYGVSRYALYAIRNDITWRT